MSNEIKILLIDASKNWLARKDKLSHLEQIVLPVGLMYLSSCLKKIFKNEVNTKIISLVVDCRTNSDLDRILENYKPDVVGIRGMPIYKDAYFEVAKKAKDYNKRIFVIGGGPYATVLPDEALSNQNIDCIAIGEAEKTIVELVQNIKENKGLSQIAGIAYRDNNKFVFTEPREFNKELDSIPFPDYEAIDLNNYSKVITYGYNRRKQAVIVSSRGCPYKCVYCHNIHGKKWRYRSAENVYQEISHLFNNYNIKDFYFVDDNVNLDYNRISRICDLLIDSRMKVNIYFANGVRGDLLDEELIDKMAKAGVIWITFALETAVPRLQKLIKKNLNLDKLRNNIEYASKKSIIVNVCFMMGFPTETYKDVMKTIDFVRKLKNIAIPMIFAAKYYPKTEMYEMAVSNESYNNELLKTAYLDAYHNIHHCETPWLSVKQASSLFLIFLRDVFLSKQRIINSMKVISKYYSENEIKDMYSIFFQKQVKDIEKDILQYAN